MMMIYKKKKEKNDKTMYGQCCLFKQVFQAVKREVYQQMFDLCKPCHQDNEIEPCMRVSPAPLKMGGEMCFFIATAAAVQHILRVHDANW